MVEHRYRHIVETGLTLMGQCKAPLKFWRYVFETFVYLINHMPTLVINYKSPFECLFRSTPDYSFLRTFRCLCIPFLHPYNAYKLDFCSSSCVFLGYNTSHLGYFCLDLSFHRIYMARHVRFHEHTFPLATSEQNNSPSPSHTSICLPQLFPCTPFMLIHFITVSCLYFPCPTYIPCTSPVCPCFDSPYKR